MNEQQKWIIEAINWLTNENVIMKHQFDECCNYYLRRYQKNPQEFETIKKELTSLYNAKKNNVQTNQNDDIEIIEEIDSSPESITMKTDDLNDYEDLEKLNNETKGIQKTIGQHPSYKKAGFMNVLLFIFLTGISSGIVFMIILNLLVK